MVCIQLTTSEMVYAYDKVRYLPPPRRLCFRHCLSLSLSVCLLASLRKNFQTDLHEIFREGWQWVNEHKIFMAIRVTYPDMMYRDTGKTCLGGGMHCPIASSFVLHLYAAFCKRSKYSESV